MQKKISIKNTNDLIFEFEKAEEQKINDILYIVDTKYNYKFLTRIRYLLKFISILPQTEFWPASLTIKYIYKVRTGGTDITAEYNNL